MRVLVHPDDFLPFYNNLMSDPKKNKAMLESINSIKQRLEESDSPQGIHHKFGNIPTYYKKRYGVQVLYHFEMPDSHRLMYTVRRSPAGHDKEVLFLELIDHDIYNRRFGYFKKKSH